MHLLWKLVPILNKMYADSYHVWCILWRGSCSEILAGIMKINTDIWLFDCCDIAQDKKIEFGHSFPMIITHAPVHINDFRGVRARYVKRTG